MPRVIVPATTANLGAGFDCLGMALKIYNQVEFETGERGLSIECEGGDCEHIPQDERNLVYRAVTQGLAAVGMAVPGLAMRQSNAIPRTRGLGSSAACVVAGLMIADHISGGALGTERMIELATEMEGHPDNVLPAILGGLTVGCKTAEGRVRHARIVPPDELRCCIFVPPYTTSTRRSRSALPQSVPMEDAVFNLSRSALFIAAVSTGELSLLSTAVEDRLHQRFRAALIPRYDKTVVRAKELGALGCFVSGSGPTIIALLSGGYDAFCEQMRAFHEGFGWRIDIVEHCAQGAHIVD